MSQSKNPASLILAYANAAKDGDTSAKFKLMTLGCALVRKAILDCGTGDKTDILKPLSALEDYAAVQKEIDRDNIIELGRLFELFKSNYAVFNTIVGEKNNSMVAQTLVGGLVNSICRIDSRLQDRLRIWSVPYGTMTELLLEFIPFAQGTDYETALCRWHKKILDELPTA